MATIYEHTENGGVTYGLDYDNNNNIIWSAGSGDILIGWDPSTQTVSQSYSLSDSCRYLVYDSDNNIVWVGFTNGTIIGYDPSTQTVEYTYSEHTDVINSMTKDNNNNIIWSVGGYQDQKVVGWDIDTQSVAFSHTEHGTTVYSSSYDHTNDIIWTGGSNYNLIGWDPSTQTVEYTYTMSNNVYSISYDSNNNIVWAVDYDNNIIGYDPSTSSVSQSYTLTLSGSYIPEIKYDHTNNLIWYVDYTGATVRGFNPSTNTVDYSHTAHNDTVFNVVIDYTNDLIWSSNSPNVIGYEFTGVTFEDPTATQYRYIDFITEFTYSENITSGAFDYVEDALLDAVANGNIGSGINTGVILDSGTVIFEDDLNTNEVNSKEIRAQLTVFEGDFGDTEQFNEIEFQDNSGNVYWLTSLDSARTDNDKRYLIAVDFISQ